MTDQHPLTDETCEDLSSCILTISTANAIGADPHICPEHIADDMRAAADWQLEQVLRFMEENGFGIRKFLLLKAAMRPQEDNNE